jgi:hypothetical protein
VCEAISATTAIAIAGVAVSAASAGAGLYMQSEQAAEQSDYQRRLMQARESEIAENYRLSLESMNVQNRALQERSVQEGEAASMEQQRNAREAAKAVSTARVAAGEGGVSGRSVNALMSDFIAQEARYRESLNTNLDFARDSIDYEMESNKLIAQGRSSAIKLYQPAKIDQPSYLGAALKIGGAGMEAYSNRMKQTGPSGTNTTPTRRFTATDSDW